jgi:hopanoid biosynthesis associated RND transporter like protein HpnN
MAKLPFTDKTKLWEASARLTLRYPWLIVLLFFMLCAASLRYTVHHLGIKNNTAELLSQDLPFQQVRLKLEKAFPQDAATIIVVVESDTPEYTALAAEQVLQRLQSQPQHFASAYIPDDNPFFRQQGFLYLDLDDLEDLSDKLIDAQPFIGHLGQNYHVAGLVDIIAQVLEAEDNAASMPLDPLLGAIDRALIKVKSKQAHYLSWQQLLTEEGFGRDQTRRLVIAKPHLDFNELMPAQQPMAYLRGLAEEMAVDYPGVTLSFTGEVALEHEELETVNQDMLVSGIASLLLVCAALWLGLRSLRLLIATFAALIAGLILTGGFAALAVGHLNLISVAFAVLYIGLGVDFATHLCLHYQENRQLGMPTDVAVLLSLRMIGRSLFLCALTTAIGFLAFVPTDFKGVGIISGAGMFIGLAVSLTLLPALLKILPIQHFPARQLVVLPDWVYCFPFRHAPAIRIGALALAVLAGFTLTRLTFDTVSVNLRDPQAPSVIAFKKLLRSQTDSPFALTALTDSLAQADRVAADFARLPSVHQVVTLSSLVPDQQAEKMELIDELNLIVVPTQLERFGRGHEASDVRSALIQLGNALEQAARRRSPTVALNCFTNCAAM